ncbi:MAG: hypothetical protein A2186_03130 [Candidatus Levybacteria bacterium RIFOXYA1_FULL_41_10]|nr:MAG: hypothetical protein UT87_C0018G0003 [Candidatus Levybacteria bacterium GW2011_GWC1_40_19]KKR94766.1 MAG: hypothetical protein UU45_C0007G0014 [Candidatus Levybacteria bacterium GW2011_GWA2_41_15]OGH21162.1 MAG: hypothetical protein A2695_00875 [Candidatus Levybacteria bacterium RIFCSPHIGHO2_01_FULL_40_83]OGH27412.1 MAG: hypothetical protein A3D82_01820 [Candidatus Levybacteria bacterium RIFCSPHIGHO2_02_FULL_40_29]OGH30372.1 MAG: hypothetical protein A3E70_03920 [Candidatus Levybacteria
MSLEKQGSVVLNRRIILSPDLIQIPAVQAAVDLHKACAPDNIFHRVAGSTAKMLIAAEIKGTVEGLSLPHDVDSIVDQDAETYLEMALGELAYKKVIKIPRPGEHVVATNNRHLYVKTGEDGQKKVLDLTFGRVDKDNGIVDISLAPYLPRIFGDRRPTLCHLVFSQTMTEGVDYVVGDDPQDVVTAFSLAALIFGFEVLMPLREIGDPVVAKRKASLISLNEMSTEETMRQKERILHDSPPAGLYLRKSHRLPLATARNPGALGIATNIIKSFHKHRHG